MQKNIRVVRAWLVGVCSTLAIAGAPLIAKAEAVIGTTYLTPSSNIQNGLPLTLSAAYSGFGSNTICSFDVNGSIVSAALSDGTATYAFSSFFGESGVGSNSASLSCQSWVTFLNAYGPSVVGPVTSFSVVPSDTTPPTVGSVTPLVATVGIEATFSASVSDPSGLDSCNVSVDGANSIVWVGNGVLSGTATRQATFNTPGAHTIRFDCYDSNGLGSTGIPATITVSSPVVSDSTGPTILALTPTSLVANTLATFSANVSDDGTGVNYCQLVEGGSAATMSLSGSTASVSYGFSTAGTKSLQVQCVDNAGNWSYGTPMSITVTAPASAPQNNDTTPPTVGTVSPGSVTVGQSSVFTASYSDVGTGVNSCELLVNGTSQGDMTIFGGVASRSRSFSAVGSDVVQVRCRDVAGNYGYSAVRTVTISAAATVPAPTPTPTPTPTPSPTPAPTVDQSLLQNLQNMGIAVHALVKLPDDGNVSTQEDSAVYYIGADGKRHGFPNSRVYFTWFTGFDGVRVITAQQLASIPLGVNVRYKPGVRMVKFTTDNKVYAVSRGGVLRWVKTEAAAIGIYGSQWNTKIDDLSDAFYTNYTFGTDIGSVSDFNVASQESSVGYISADYGL